MLEFQIEFISYEVSNSINTYKKSALFCNKAASNAHTFAIICLGSHNVVIGAYFDILVWCNEFKKK